MFAFLREEGKPQRGEGVRNRDSMVLAASKINKTAGKRTCGQSHRIQWVGVPSCQMSRLLINLKISVAVKGTLHVPSFEAVCSAGSNSGLTGQRRAPESPKCNA